MVQIDAKWRQTGSGTPHLSSLDKRKGWSASEDLFLPSLLKFEYRNIDPQAHKDSRSMCGDVKPEMACHAHANLS